MAAVVGGIVAAIVAVVVAVINQLSLRSMQRQRISADQALAERKISADIDLAERKFTYDRELAERKFAYDREFNDHKRRVELAEEVLAGFIKMRDIIREVRSPMSFGNEGEDRPKWDGETDQQAKARRTYFVPASRLMKHADFINTLMTKRYRMSANFGPEAEVPFTMIWETLAHIQSAVRMMMSSISPSGLREGPTDLWQKWESAIWAGAEQPDPHEDAGGKGDYHHGSALSLCRAWKAHIRRGSQSRSVATH